MAKHKREYHTCDFCGIEMDKPYHGGEAGTYCLSMEEDFAVAGQMIVFKELCKPCNEVVGRMIDDIKEHAKAARVARAAEREGGSHE